MNKDGYSPTNRIRPEMINARKMLTQSPGLDAIASPFADEFARSCVDPVREAMRQLTRMPLKGTPAAELTEGEKLALFIAAGAPTRAMMDGHRFTVQTTVPCAVADCGDGGYIVVVGDFHR